MSETPQAIRPSGLYAQQAPSTVFMVRPAAFGANPQTMASNAFQHQPQSGQAQTIHQQALQEFDAAVRTLQDHGVDVVVFEDTPLPVKPDAIFPNNWVSFHADGTVALYPMEAPNRRLERRDDVLGKLREAGFIINEIWDLSAHERHGRYLEGTGSLVFDIQHGLVYAALSSRTDEALARKAAAVLGYEPVLFASHPDLDMPVYHTNVLMAHAGSYAVFCFEAIHPEDRQAVEHSFAKNHVEVVPITLEQMKRFAGNMMQVSDAEGKRLLVASQQAWDSLDTHQRARLESHNPVVVIPIATIEHYGGGSIRCMMTGVFLPKE